MMNDSMVVEKHRRLAELHQELATLGPVMRGSVVVIGTRNKQPYFSLNKGGKTKLVYLGKNNARESLAQMYSDNYKRLQAIVEEMTEVNMELLKNITGGKPRVPVIANEE